MQSDALQGGQDSKSMGFKERTSLSLRFFFLFVFVFVFVLTSPIAYGSSQARNQIQATAVTNTTMGTPKMFLNVFVCFFVFWFF